MVYISLSVSCVYEGASYLHPVCVVVQQQDSRAGYFLGFHHRLQISQQAHVFGHVSCQYLEEGKTQRIT